MGGFENLPDELVVKIVGLHHLTLVSRRLHAISTPHRYRNIQVYDQGILLLARACVLNPTLGTLVRSLSVRYDEAPETPWSKEDFFGEDDLAEERRTVAKAARPMDPILADEIERKHPWTPSASVVLLLHLLPRLLKLDIAPERTSKPIFHLASRCLPTASGFPTTLPPALSSITSLRIAYDDWEGGNIISALLPWLSLPVLTTITMHSLSALIWRHSQETRATMAQLRGVARSLHTIIFQESVLESEVLADIIRIPQPGVLSRLEYEVGGTNWDASSFVDTLAPLYSSLVVLSITRAERLCLDGMRFRVLPHLREFSRLVELTIDADFLLDRSSRGQKRELLDVLPPALEILSVDYLDSWLSYDVEAQLLPVVYSLRSLRVLRVGAEENLPIERIKHRFHLTSGFIATCGAEGVAAGYLWPLSRLNP